MRPTATVCRSRGRSVCGLIGGALVAFVLLLLGYLAVIVPQRSTTNGVQAQVSWAQTHNSALQLRLNQLRAQNNNPATYQKDYAEARPALPSSSGGVRSTESSGNAAASAVTTVRVSA